MRRGVERVLRPGNPLSRRIFGGVGGADLLTALIEQLKGGEALRHEGRCALEFLLGELDLGLLLHEVRLRLVERTLRLAHQRLGLLQRGLDIAGIHHRDDLARRYHVAFIQKAWRYARQTWCRCRSRPIRGGHFRT